MKVTIDLTDDQTATVRELVAMDESPTAPSEKEVVESILKQGFTLMRARTIAALDAKTRTSDPGAVGPVDNGA